MRADLKQLGDQVIAAVQGYVRGAVGHVTTRVGELEARLNAMPAGPRGEAGTPGERGPQGERGAEGERGEPGADADPDLIGEAIQREFSAMAEAFIQGANEDAAA